MEDVSVDNSDVASRIMIMSVSSSEGAREMSGSYGGYGWGCSYVLVSVQ